jgi:macrolide-specific efflux system membrane fusion protein
MMRGMKLRKILAPGAAAALLALAGWRHWRKPPAQDPRLRTVAVVEGPIQAAIETTGAVTPFNRIEVKPPISGRVDKLLVNEGEAVKEGQVLAWMSSSDRAAILDAARAMSAEEVKRWEDSYRPTPIVAPLSGVVILRNVVQGQTVDQGTVLYAISDSLIVTAQVDEADIGRVAKGMPARVVLDAYPGVAVEGVVFDILYEGKNVSNVITYGVKIRPVKAPPFFRSQMTATVSFITGRKEKALILPLAAVRESPSGGKRVLVPGPEGKPEPRDIEVGMESGEQVEVLSGLQAGDKVVLGSGRYVPQQGPASSPLAIGGRRSGQGGDSGRAPRPRKTQ